MGLGDFFLGLMKNGKKNRRENRRSDGITFGIEIRSILTFEHSRLSHNLINQIVRASQREIALENPKIVTKEVATDRKVFYYRLRSKLTYDDW